MIPRPSIVCTDVLLVRIGWALLGACVAALLASVPRQSALTRATKVWSHVKRAYPRSQRYCAINLFTGAFSDGARKHPSQTIFKPRLSRCATSESVITGGGRRLRLGTLGCLCCCLARVGATSKRANPAPPRCGATSSAPTHDRNVIARLPSSPERAPTGPAQHPSPTFFKPRLSRCATSESVITGGGRRLRLGTLGCLCCCLARVGATSKPANPRHQGVEPRQARLPTIATLLRDCPLRRSALRRGPQTPITDHLQAEAFQMRDE